MSDNEGGWNIGWVIPLIVALAGYYWGKDQGYYWLWKICQIILWIYGIVAGILLVILLVVLCVLMGYGIAYLIEWLRNKG